MEALASALQRRLGELVLGVYLTGSAATPDFEPASSDVDAFVVLTRRLGADEFARLRELHRELPESVPDSGRLELEYVALDQLRPWGIEGESISVSPGEELHVGQSNAAADDILGARELSVAVIGPPAQEVFPEVDRETFVASQKNWLDDLLTRDRLRPDAADEEYAEWTLNIARCLFGIGHGHGCTKPHAAAWLAGEARELSGFVEAALAARRGEPVTAEVKAGFPHFVREARKLLPHLVDVTRAQEREQGAGSTAQQDRRLGEAGRERARTDPDGIIGADGRAPR